MKLVFPGGVLAYASELVLPEDVLNLKCFGVYLREGDPWGG